MTIGRGAVFKSKTFLVDIDSYICLKGNIAEVIFTV